MQQWLHECTWMSDSQAVWLYHSFQAIKQFRDFFVDFGVNYILLEDNSKLCIQFLK